MRFLIILLTLCACFNARAGYVVDASKEHWEMPTEVEERLEWIDDELISSDLCEYIGEQFKRDEQESSWNALLENECF